MNKGISLTALAQKIEAQKTMKADYVAPAKELNMAAHDDGTLVLEHASIGSLPILETAHDQIGAKLAIPAKYYDRMRASAPRLLADNVNEWLGRDGDRRMLRTMGGDLRAFLSDRYHRIENEEIAETTLPILLDTPGLSIVSCEVTDRRMYIVATTSRIQGDVKVGDTVQAGIAISNSEIGHGAVSIRPLIYRLVCSNGMVIPDGKLTARHVGRRIGEGNDLNAIFSDEAKRADDKALLLKVRDTVRYALSEAAFNPALERMRALADQTGRGDVTKSVEVLGRKIGATEAERGGILRSLIEGGDLSAWGFVNAVTHQAHTASYDRSMELVAQGGDLLNLSRGEWSEILQAA